MIISYSRRISDEELIDQPETSTDDIHDNLRDMTAINRWLGGAQAVMAHALPLLMTCASDPIRVLDAACGGGDISRRVVDETRMLGKRIEVTVLDLNTRVLGCARELSSGYPEIEFVQADALNPPFETGYFDIVILATFIHHLESEQVITALRMGKRVSRGHVIVADLVHSPWAHLGFCILSRLVRFSPISVHDGAISVRRAYNPSELADFARRSGIDNWKLYRHWLYRMTLVYEGASYGKRNVSAH